MSQALVVSGADVAIVDLNSASVLDVTFDPQADAVLQRRRQSIKQRF